MQAGKLRRRAGPYAQACLSLIADADGVLYFLEAQATALLQQEWPGWQPPQLPVPLRDTLAANQCYQGRHCRVTARHDCGLSFIRVSASRGEALTVAAWRVARLVLQGLTYKEMARALQLSPSTVSNQLQSVYQKLAVDNKVALCRKVQCMLEGHFDAVSPH